MRYTYCQGNIFYVSIGPRVTRTGESPGRGQLPLPRAQNELTLLEVKREVTCGSRISDSPTSDNLNPQETTKQDVLEMGTDGLSCPGSRVVAGSVSNDLDE